MSSADVNSAQQDLDEFTRWLRDRAGVDTWEDWEVRGVSMTGRLAQLLDRTVEEATAGLAVALRDIESTVRELEKGWPNPDRGDITVADRILIMVNRTRECLEIECTARQDAQRRLDAFAGDVGDDPAELSRQRNEAVEAAETARRALQAMTADRDRYQIRESYIAEINTSLHSAARRVASTAHRVTRCVDDLNRAPVEAGSEAAAARDGLNTAAARLVDEVTADPVRPDLGATVARLRYALGVDRVDLGRAIGLEGHQVRDIESGAVAVSAPMMALVLWGLAVRGRWPDVPGPVEQQPGAHRDRM